MAVGELIGGAIGILLLVIVAYILVGATLTTAETVSAAQQDIIQNQITRLHTDIKVSHFNVTGGIAYFNITNTGGETISTLYNTDVFISANDGSSPHRYQFSNETSSNTWRLDTTFSPTGIIVVDTNGVIHQEFIHPGQLDPGETLSGTALFIGGIPSMIEVVTSNGAHSSAYTDI